MQGYSLTSKFLNVKPQIILLDLFSGYGGFHKGLEDASIDVAHGFFSEIDTHAIANYRFNYPNSTYVGSVTETEYIAGLVQQCRDSNSGLPLIITFGSPCQDFSLAGGRTGLEGSKSSLITAALALIERLRPDVYIWENVKGVYSSNAGADYWAIQQAFANIHGYRREQQLLNTAWFLPQNRERLYLVGHLATSARSGREVFPIGETAELHNERQCKKPSKFASTLNAGDAKSWVGNFINEATTLHGADVVKVTSATNAGYEEATEGDSINLSNPDSKTRRGRVGKGKAQILDTSCNQAVVITHNYIQTDPNNTGHASAPHRIYTPLSTSPTLRAKDEVKIQTVQPILTPDSSVKSKIIQVNTAQEFGGSPRQQNRVYDTDGIMPTLNSSGNNKTPKIQTVQPILTPDRPNKRQNGRRLKDDGEEAFTLTAQDKHGVMITDSDKVATTTRIRRLTEIECEKLQGLPPNWTQWGYYSNKQGELVLKEISSTQRYKLCGNGVTAKVVEQIGLKLIALLQN